MIRVAPLPDLFGFTETTSNSGILIPAAASGDGVVNGVALP
jgi:hypothetical protein